MAMRREHGTASSDPDNDNLTLPCCENCTHFRRHPRTGMCICMTVMTDDADRHTRDCALGGTNARTRCGHFVTRWPHAELKALIQTIADPDVDADLLPGVLAFIDAMSTEQVREDIAALRAMAIHARGTP